MNGCVVPGTPIAVDMWKVRQHPSVKLFFLSHMHGDHTVGLTASFKDYIYCSPVSGRLLKQRIKVKECYIKTLELNTSHLLPLDESGRETMTVTLIDANHCPGAVMFLFQGYFGSILYTGDMRYHSDMFTDPSPLSQLSTPIDVLYLDNTYNDPQCVFSTRDEATREILDIIRAHPEHDILLGMKNLGKEDLFVQVAKELNEWIIVTDDTYNDFKVLELPNVFTTDHKLGRVKIVKSFQITTKAIDSLNRQYPTIGIIPTALFTGTKLNPYTNNEKIFVVNYSDHSSYTELHDFVSQVKPRSINPVVKCSRGVFNSDWTTRGDMSCFSYYLDPTPKVAYEIPPSVKHYMNAGNYDPCDSTKDSRRRNIAMIKRYRLQRAQSFPRINRSKGIVFPDSPVDNETKSPIRTHIIFDRDDHVEQIEPDSVKDNPSQLERTTTDSLTNYQDVHSKQDPEVSILFETTSKKAEDDINTHNQNTDDKECTQRNQQSANLKNESTRGNGECFNHQNLKITYKKRKLPLTITQPLAKRYNGKYPGKDNFLDTWLQCRKPEASDSTKQLSSIRNIHITSQEKQIGECISVAAGTVKVEAETSKSFILPFKDGAEKNNSILSESVKSSDSNHKDGSTGFSVGQEDFKVRTLKSLKCKPLNINVKNTKVIPRSKSLGQTLTCKPLEKKTKS